MVYVWSIAGISGGWIVLSLSLYLGSLLTDLEELRPRLCLLLAVGLEIFLAPAFIFSTKMNVILTLAIIVAICLFGPLLFLSLFKHARFQRCLLASCAHFGVLFAIVMVFGVLILGGIEKIPLLLSGKDIFAFDFEF